MPQVALPALLGGITFSGTIATGFTIGFSLANALLSGFVALAGSLLTPKQQGSAAFTQEVRDRTVVVRSPVSPHRAIYGRAQVSGTMVFATVTGSSTKYLHMVIVLAGRQIEEIGALYLNDHKIDLTDEDASGNVTAGDYAGHVRIKRHLGDPDQVADADLVAETSEWTSNHRLRGRAYIYVRLKQSNDVFPTGIPNPKVDAKGHLLYDPRTTTTAYSENAALVNYDYIRWSNGFNASASEVDDPNWIAAANACDELVVIDAQNNTQPRYTCNGTFTLDASPISVIEGLLTSMAGKAVWNMAVWAGYPGVSEVSSFAIDEGGFRGNVRFQNKPGRARRFNAVRGTYVNPDDHWQQTDFAPQKNALYETEDGGDRIYQDVELPYTIDHIEAQRLAKVELEDHRQGLTATLPLKLGVGIKLLAAQVGDITLSPLGWAAKPFRIRSWGLALDDNGGIGVDVTVQEYADQVYDWNFGEATITDLALNTNLPSPRDVATPTGLVLASGNTELLEQADGTVVSRLRLDWDNPNDSGVEGTEIQYKKTADMDWNSLPTARPGETTAWTSNVLDGETYDVRIRHQNLFRVRSTWLVESGHLLVGKDAKPPTPDWFSVVRQPDGTREFSFGLDPANTPADVRSGGGFVLRVRLGTGHLAADLIGHEVHDGIKTPGESPWETNQLAAGTYTAGCWTVDSSGNESAAPLIIQSTLGDPRINNALAFESIHAQGWPGTKTNCAVDDTGNTLTAQGQETWDSLTTWDAWTAWAQNPYTQIIYEHPMIDLGAVVAFVPLISVDSSSGNPTIEIDYSDDNVAWNGWVVPTGQISARYVKVRIIENQAVSEVPQLNQATIILAGNTEVQEFLDVNTSTWVGSAAVGREIPISAALSTVTKIGLALQNVGSGWSWEIISKNPTPTIKIYNNGTAADATVDAEVTGLPST